MFSQDTTKIMKGSQTLKIKINTQIPETNAVRAKNCFILFLKAHDWSFTMAPDSGSFRLHLVHMSRSTNSLLMYFSF